MSSNDEFVEIGGLVFNKTRTIAFITHLLEQWQRQALGFRYLTTFQPEEVMVRELKVDVGSLRHAQLLFLFGWFQRAGDNANNLTRKFVKLAKENPAIVDPGQDPDKWDYEALETVIPFGKTREGERIGWYKTVFDTIKRKYGTDPRRFFLEYGDSRDRLLQAFDDQFPGVKEKIASLITHWFQVVNWPEDQDRWAHIRTLTMFPADIWVMRIFYQLGLITSWRNDRKEYLSPKIAKFICGLCDEYGLPWADLSQAFWHMGSWICGRRPEGITRELAYCGSLCPGHPYCQQIITARDEINRNGHVGYTERTTRIRVNPGELPIGNDNLFAL